MTARQYFLHCDNVVVSHDDETHFFLSSYTQFSIGDKVNPSPVEKAHPAGPRYTRQLMGRKQN